MDANSRKKPSQFEINDLIAEAVVNAEARHNQAEKPLSDEELVAVKGGSLGYHIPIIITWGYMRAPDPVEFP